MDFKKYRMVRETVSRFGDEYLNELSDRNPGLLLPYCGKENPVKYSYLHEFLEKKGWGSKNQKAFVRNIERLVSGNLEQEEIRKVLSSMLTHLHIEQDNNDVPECVLHDIKEKYDKAFTDPGTVVEEFITDLQQLELVDSGRS